MYESYWNLSRKPFGSGCDVAAYYPSEAHQGTLLKLRYAVEGRRGAALLAGIAGTGKSLVAKLLAERLPDAFSPVVHLTFPQMPAANLLAYLARELQTEDIGREPTIETSVRAIERKLTTNAADGGHAVILVDEAHLLDGNRTFEALRLLLNCEYQGSPTATLVFVGQTSLLPVVARMPALEQRLAVKCLLRSLTHDETHAYVQHRLQTAGGATNLFEPEALDAVHEIAQGTPRDVNRLCDLALLLGFADEASTIDADRIQTVARELVEATAD